MSKKVTRTCPCGKTFEVPEWKIRAGRGKRCSKECQYKYATRPSGLEYNIAQENRGWFKEGCEPWNKGTTGLMPEPWNKGLEGLRMSPDTEFKPGHEPWNRGTKGAMPSQEDHHAWKGDEVGYVALHEWVRKTLWKNSICQHCGRKTDTHWANKSHEYNRDVNDWLELCPRCHGKYDSGENFGAAVKKYGKRR